MSQIFQPVPQDRLQPVVPYGAHFSTIPDQTTWGGSVSMPRIASLG